MSGGFSGVTTVRMRGAEGNHTLVLVDGIEANSTNGGEFDFSDLLTSDIERIEVIRGGHSGIYGSKAIGGVINIITRSGKGPTTAEVAVEGGGLETRAIAGRVASGTDAFWLSVAAQYRASDAFNIAPVGTEDDPWKASTVTLKGGAQLLPGMTLDFTVRKSQKDANFDAFAAIPGSPFLGAADAPNTGTSDVLLAGGKLRWDLFDGAFTQILKATHNDSELVSASPFSRSENLSEASKLGYLATYRFAVPQLLASRHAVTGLVEKELEAFTPISAFSDGVKREREKVAGVIEYRGEFADTVFVSASVRHDNNDTFADFTTWRTSVSIPLRSIGIRPHASVGTSVALPGMFEQFGSVVDRFVSNPNLVPEESFGWDAGVEFTLPGGGTVVDVTYFRANLENEIAGFGNTLINLDGESTREGVEVALRSQLTPWLFFGASYTFLAADDAAGFAEVRRPRHTGKADITAKFDDGRGTFNVAAIYNGDMKDSGFDAFFNRSIVTLDDYVLVNAALSYQVDPRIELFVRGENLLNTDYEEVLDYNTPGLTAYAGVRIKLEDPSTQGWAQYRD